MYDLIQTKNKYIAKKKTFKWYLYWIKILCVHPS